MKRAASLEPAQRTVEKEKPNKLSDKKSPPPKKSSVKTSEKKQRLNSAKSGGSTCSKGSKHGVVEINLPVACFST